MNRFSVTGGTVITPSQERFVDVCIAGGLIESLGKAATDGEKVDASGCYVTPGLIDLQLNGGEPCDFWQSPDALQVQKLASFLLQAGVTTFLPTLITAKIEHIVANTRLLESLGVGEEVTDASQFSLIKNCHIRMPGIHLEGPCLSPQRPGVHPPECLQPLSVAVLKQLIRPAVKLITVAPELDESGKSIAFLLDHQVRVSLGHSNSTFEEAQKAFDAGVRLVTHTYNALPPLHHRAPGAVIASMLDERVTNCVIADGLHVDAAAIKLLLKVKGVDKVILVTDAAHIGTTGGGLVGSSITLSQAVCNVVKWQLCSFPEAIRMATVNPAQSMGWSDKIGTLAPGSCADFILWNKEDLTIKQVYVAGELQYNAAQPLAAAQ